MITAVLAIAVLLPRAQARTKAGDLVSKMLAHYYGAQSLAGKISLTQSASDSQERGVAHGEVDVQFQRPSRLFVKQSIDSKETRGIARIVSNGSKFLYSLPKDESLISADSGASPNRELVENVVQWNDKEGKDQALQIGEIYVIGRSGLYLKPEPLDLAIGQRSDLKSFVAQLATVEDRGDKTINGKTAHLIGGDWRQYDSAPVSGTYEIAISDDGDLIRYTRKESLAGPSNTVVDIITQWDVDIQVGGQVDPKVFQDRAFAPPNQGSSAPADNGAPSGSSGKPPR
jgi:hypothetical protein